MKLWMKHVEMKLTGRWFQCVVNTVDGRNPAPVDMENISSFAGILYSTSKRWFSRQDFWSINSRVTYMGGIWCLFDTHLFLSKDLGCFTTHHQETGKECGIGNMWHWGVEIEPPDALMLLKHLEEISIWNDGGAIPIEIHELSGAYLTVFFVDFFVSSCLHELHVNVFLSITWLFFTILFITLLYVPLLYSTLDHFRSL